MGFLFIIQYVTYLGPSFCSFNNPSTICIVDHSYWMQSAIAIARQGLDVGEVPVGCIILYHPSSTPIATATAPSQCSSSHSIIATAHNEVTRTRNATRHAELVALDRALDYCAAHSLAPSAVLRFCTMYVTCEPCIMCAPATLAGPTALQRVVYGCANERFGGCGSVGDIGLLLTTNSSERLCGGVCALECALLLKQFYEQTNPNAPPHKRKQKP